LVKTLFVDTNIFLSLYAFSDDDIEQFRSLFVLAQEGEIDFLLSQQVIDEFWRNREAKIAESLQPLKSSINLRMPAPFRELPEAAALVVAQKDFEACRKTLVEEFVGKAASHELNADELIKEIFAKSTVIKVTAEILESAEHRVTLGNPPGKSGSYGDAINWECILANLGVLDDLCFVSRGKDYASRLHAGEFNEFLKQELMNDQLSSIYFFDSLRAFMNSEFAGVEIDAFTEAYEAVQVLEASGSFAATHAAISNLTACSGFSVKQAKRLIVVAEENSQVGAILGDSDVSGFYEKLFSDHKESLDKPWWKRLIALTSETEGELSAEFDEVPF
jgi:predicted nucleic acid-binding protein